MLTHRNSGLIDAIHRLRAIRGVSIVELTGADIVRHPLVQRIVEAYDAALSGRSKRKPKNTTGTDK